MFLVQRGRNNTLDQSGTNNPESEIHPLSPSSALELMENVCHLGLVKIHPLIGERTGGKLLPTCTTDGEDAEIKNPTARSLGESQKDALVCGIANSQNLGQTTNSFAAELVNTVCFSCLQLFNKISYLLRSHLLQRF